MESICPRPKPPVPLATIVSFPFGIYLSGLVFIATNLHHQVLCLRLNSRNICFSGNQLKNSQLVQVREENIDSVI